MPADRDEAGLRHSQPVPVLSELRAKLPVWKEQLLPKHPIGNAINYALGQWQKLAVFSSDGAVSIDNNASGHEMKRAVLNRKNSFLSATRADEEPPPSSPAPQAPAAAVSSRPSLRVPGHPLRFGPGTWFTSPLRREWLWLQVFGGLCRSSDT